MPKQIWQTLLFHRTPGKKKTSSTLHFFSLGISHSEKQPSVKGRAQHPSAIPAICTTSSMTRGSGGWVLHAPTGASATSLIQAFLGAGFDSSGLPRKAPKLSLTTVSKASMASARCPAALSTRLLGDASSSRITKLCSPWAFFNSCCKPTAEKMVRKSSMASKHGLKELTLRAWGRFWGSNVQRWRKSHQVEVGFLWY